MTYHDGKVQAEKPFYSSNIVVDLNESEKVHPGDWICQKNMARSTHGTYYQISVPKSALAQTFVPIDSAQKWVELPGKDGAVVRFPVQTVLPKVQMLRIVPTKQRPRDVEVNRRKREYQAMDFRELLRLNGFPDQELRPTEHQFFNMYGDAPIFTHFLPLSFFDDSDYDAYSPKKWLERGWSNSINYNLPALAFIPWQNSLVTYHWQYVKVVDYNNVTQSWIVQCLSNELDYQIPAIQLFFLAEDPRRFLARIIEATQRRNEAEMVLKMEAIVDCVLHNKIEARREFLLQPYIERLMRGIKAHPAFLALSKMELYLIYEHLMTAYELERFIKEPGKDFKNWDANVLRKYLPKAFKVTTYDEELRFIKSLKLNLVEISRTMLLSYVLYVGKGIEAMAVVVEENHEVESKNMFVCNFNRALPLNDFMNVQNNNSTNVSNYLKNNWPRQIIIGVTHILRVLGKGWLDISINDFTVYMISKISKFVDIVKYRMQDAMQTLLEKSIISFSNFMCAPCLQFLELKPTYKWPIDEYKISPFPWKKPIFNMVLGINPVEEKVAFSDDPEKFESSLIDLFKVALQKSNGVKRVDAAIMSHLRFAPNLYILSVELIEDLYVIHNALLQRCYKQAVIPLRAYAKLYERFIPFYMLEINDFMAEYAAAHHASITVKLDIIEHKRQKDELRQILPSVIVIGPFEIVVEALKNFLIKKHIEVVRRLFEYYVDRMAQINERLLDEGQAIFNKIADRPQSIEHLLEIRDYAEIVTEHVDKLRGNIQIMWLEYEVLDFFYYNLSDQQFAMKWEAYSWPFKILNRLLTLRDEQKNDIEDFKRQHTSECVEFEERLESLNEEVQAFSLVFNPLKVMETSVEVKKTWKQIDELRKHGEVLRYRQKLFELGDFSLEFLDSIVGGFIPYRNLWSACWNFIKLEEATTGNPLVSIELPEVWQSLQELRQQLEKSFKTFAEKPEVQGVAVFYLERIDEFVLVYKCMEWLKNEHWLMLHWQELSNRAGIDVKYSLAMNFSYCMKKGIMDHLDLVKEISDKAESEAEALRLAFEEEERRKEEARLAIIHRKAMRKCRFDI